MIPTWLQKFAGNEKTPAFFSSPSGTRNLHWSSLTLPACNECNTKYSKLENDTKAVFAKIEEGKVLASDVSTLLDWLDKVRIGYWLLMLTHGKSSHSIDPNFAINQRIAKADRLVRVFKYPDAAKGIAVIGSNTGAFWRMPSAMTIVIKDIVLLSVSSGGFLSETMGLIDRVKVINKMDPRDRLSFGELTGKYKRAWSADFFRFKQNLFFEFHNVMDNQLQRNNTLYSDSSGAIRKVEEDSPIAIEVVKRSNPLLGIELKIEVLEIQRTLLGTFSRLDLDKRMILQLKRNYRELDDAIDELIYAYNVIAPLPTFRRSYLRYI